MKKNEMGGVSGTYGGEERRGEMYIGFWWRNKRKRTNWKI
jgi:hypothetical protein